MKTHGFTLVELLVVIAILAILITLSSKGLRTARVSAKKAQALVEMKSIETAVKAYVNKYGKLPVANDQQGHSDLAFDENTSLDTLAILTAEDLALNPTEMIFLEAQRRDSSALPGTFLDPWGVQYLIALDSDYDGQIVFEGQTIRRKVAIYSIGLSQLSTPCNTNHFIKSW